MTAVLAQALHAFLVLAAAPLLAGLIRRIKSRLLGRAGPPVVQPWRDLIRLSRKDRVVADGASILFRAAPFAVFGCVYAAALLVPSFALGMAFAPLSDLLVIAGLLGAARCALALAGMDAGTAFGGIGASREMTFAAFAEPAFLLVIFTFALLAGTTNLDAAATLLSDGALGLRVSLGLAFCATVIAGLTDSGRYPADNPATHLELTMVHEASALEYSGRDLALIELAGALRLLVWFDLIGAAFAPFGMASADSGLPGWIAGLGAWAGKLALMAACLAVFETSRAKMRVFRVPELLGAAVLLGVLAALLLFVSQGFAA
jgi:formate hydrogenlyase subunit 4